MPVRALAPQASASANSATRTVVPGPSGPAAEKRLARWPPAARTAIGHQAVARALGRLACERCRPTCREVPVSESTVTTETRAEREVVDICRDLIAIDTSNYGDDSGPGERKA